VTSTARSRVLKALEDAAPDGVPTAVLCQPRVGGVRFGGRIHELRQEGHQIRTRYLRPGSHLYTLVVD
jgi:hypothetical protein